MGHHLLMGRKTYESIGRLLPGRTTVVITRQTGFEAEGVQVAHTIDDAIELARQAGATEAFVAGGAEIYRQTLEHADKVLELSSPIGLIACLCRKGARWPLSPTPAALA